MKTTKAARRAWLLTCTTLTAGFCGFAAPAHAQTSESDEEIVVTGTSIRGIAPVGSSVQSIDREELEAGVKTTPADFLRELPQLQTLGATETPATAQSATGNTQRGTSVNIRGVGTNATLLLVDGRRVAQTGAVTAFTDANQIPVAAMERIEIIADGASAIYGSDAVAGVVNYITRKRYDGVQLTARGTYNDDYTSSGGSLLAGTHWSIKGREGSVWGVYDYDYRNEYQSGDNPQLKQDLRPFGGPDNRIRTNAATAAAPGNIIVPAATNNTVLVEAGAFTYYGIPLGTSGTAASLRLNQPNLADTADYQTYLPETKRNQVVLNVRQDLTSWLNVSYFGSYGDRHSETKSYPTTTNRTVPSTVPYYITGVPGVAANAPLTVNFALFKDIGIAVTDAYEYKRQNSLTFKADLPADWQGEFMINDSRNKICARCFEPLSGNLNVTALQTAINNGTYNPFISAPAADAVLQTIYPAGKANNKSALREYQGRLDGPVATLPGGELRAAVGVGYVDSVQSREAGGIQGLANVPYVQVDRQSTAAYGEVFVPLVGGDFTLPFVRRLDVDVAVRTEDYSDAGRTTNPKIGVNWEAVQGLTFRGAWGTSFRAPDLIAISPQFFSTVSVISLTNRAGDPTIPVQNTANSTTSVVSVSGSNPDLKPEKATNYSLGLDIRPAALPGFSASLTYYNIKYEDQIFGLTSVQNTFLSNPQSRALYAPFIVAAPQPSTCVAGQQSTYNPLYLNTLNRQTNTTVDQTNFCNAAAIVYVQQANAATTEQDGIDFRVNYRFTTGDWRWNLSGSFTKILKNDFQTVVGVPAVELLDHVNEPVSLRGRVGLGVTRGPLTISPSLTYIGEYRNNVPLTINGVLQPEKDIPAWTTIDLSASYRVAAKSGLAKGVSVALNVQNIGDRDPPVVLSTNGNAMDTQNADPFGRIISLQLSKDF